MSEPQPHQPHTRQRLIVAAYGCGLLQGLLTILAQRSQVARP